MFFIPVSSIRKYQVKNRMIYHVARFSICNLQRLIASFTYQLIPQAFFNPWKM